MNDDLSNAIWSSSNRSLNPNAYNSEHFLHMSLILFYTHTNKMKNLGKTYNGLDNFRSHNIMILILFLLYIGTHLIACKRKLLLDQIILTFHDDLNRFVISIQHKLIYKRCASNSTSNIFTTGLLGSSTFHIFSIMLETFQ